jgi:[ribosomal protein S5]-alanine N-acetyltransferase
MMPFDAVAIPTKRLTLRVLTYSDAQALFEMFSDTEVMRYWSSPPLTDLSQIHQMLDDIHEDYSNHRALQLGIERQADNLFVGTCVLYHFHFPSRRAELGYALGRPFWGLGYMQEALIAFINYAFETLDLNRLEADIDPRNLASAKTLERLGFQKEGLLRERWIVSGEVSDTGFYGLLRKDWLERSPVV